MTNAGSPAILNSVNRLQKLAGPATGGVPAGTPFFITEGDDMAKPFMTYDQQLQKMRDKHLIIADDDRVKETLRQVGYFSLISGYKDLFKNPTTRDYRDGTTFQDIVTLYRFDESLRELTLRHLLHVEQHIRSALSYAFCDTFGDSQSAYLDPNHYNLGNPKNQADIQKLIQKYLQPLLRRQTDYPYIEHHKKVHQNVPLWVLMSVLTFGTLSKMYSLSKPQIQSAVSQEFAAINEKQLAQTLRVLSAFRNVCAHGERLFSYRCSKYEIPDLLLHKKLAIPRKGNQYIYGKRDYFSVVLSFRYLLPNDEFLAYKRHLAQLLTRAVKRNQQISEMELLKIMGLPSNWKRITAYKKA